MFISEKGSIQVAVDAIRKGAYDYLSKPINPAQLIESVRKALDFQALIAEDQQIKMRLRRRSDPDIFAGSSSVMSEIDQLIRQIATTDVTVLIEGESGAGKEIVARAVHERSRRSARPFIAVNCAALHDNLLESELFGHVRGAFTGAIGDRKCRFQLAHEVVKIFKTLPWPGNVRQLRNVVERLVVTIPRPTITAEDLPLALIRSVSPERTFSVRPGMSLAQVEAELIRQTLLNVTPNRTEAAKKLGISRRALQYKIKRYGLSALTR